MGMFSYCKTKMKYQSRCQDEIKSPSNQLQKTIVRYLSGSVVQKLDGTIYQINHYPVDN